MATARRLPVSRGGRAPRPGRLRLRVHGGRFESRHQAGRAAGFVPFVEDVDRPPIELRYKRSGLIWMSAGPGRAARGDCVAVVMTDYVEPTDSD